MGYGEAQRKCVRLLMHDTVDRALNMATAATQAEHNERLAMREAKEDRRTVFTVRGHRRSERGKCGGPAM